MTAGCTSPREFIANGWKVGPSYARPVAPVAPDWIDANDVRISKQSSDVSGWWVAFNDPTFSALMEQAYRQNLTLRAAGYRIMQARAARSIAAGGLFPQRQLAFADYTNNLRSTRAVQNVVTPNRHFDIWDSGFNMAWELDLWGRYRRAIEAADADLESSVENYDDVLVTLLADAGAAYVQMRTFESRLELARRNVAAQRGSYEIAASRFRAGKTSELDVDQAKSNLAQTEAAIPQLEASRRLATHRLCVLLGRPCEDIGLQLGAGPIPSPPREIVVGIPADLIRRRPDIRRAERALAAQSARIGVAEADLYPALSINGELSVRSSNFNDLFASGAAAGFVGPGVRWNVLNYGRLLNNVRLHEARFQELAVNYQGSVLTAGREAEDALAQHLQARDRLATLAEGVTAAQRSNDLVVKMYREGKVDFNRVFNIQAQLAVQQDAFAQAAGDVALSLIAVYRAMGGGWQIRLSGDGPTWCDGCCPTSSTCIDDFCPKDCPVCLPPVDYCRDLPAPLPRLPEPAPVSQPQPTRQPLPASEPSAAAE